MDDGEQLGEKSIRCRFAGFYRLRDRSLGNATLARRLTEGELHGFRSSSLLGAETLPGYS